MMRMRMRWRCSVREDSHSSLTCVDTRRRLPNVLRRRRKKKSVSTSRSNTSEKAKNTQIKKKRSCISNMKSQPKTNANKNEAVLTTAPPRLLSVNGKKLWVIADPLQVSLRTAPPQQHSSTAFLPPPILLSRICIRPRIRVLMLCIIRMQMKVHRHRPHPHRSLRSRIYRDNNLDDR
jgi:hypothetical protein